MRISGYAAVFGVETVIAGAFRERIARGAFREAVKRDDVRSLFNHDPNILLGRKSAGTVELSEDTYGLRYSVEVNEKDPIAVGVASRVERKDVTGSSFWFEIASPDDELWQIDDPNKLPLRTLLKLSLIDVGPVSFPAYAQASSSLIRGDNTLEAFARLRDAKAAIAAARRL